MNPWVKQLSRVPCSFSSKKKVVSGAQATNQAPEDCSRSHVCVVGERGIS
jgi:hypothetical protein